MKNAEESPADVEEVEAKETEESPADVEEVEAEETEESELQEPVKEESTKMPEELIKKLQQEPLHRKRGMGSKKILQGMVDSNRADKSIIVRIENQVAHPLYKKYYKKSKKIMAHDENNDCNIGDFVRVEESRPLSTRKRWVLTDIISRAK